ncbi:MAG: GrpB family protein [Anaerolineales bacterium]|jgi:GrpB-like predicted nucleotidyltransferase (UPF0157 family)
MIGQHKRDITVKPYQHGWIDLFQREANLLRTALGENALQIEHIGSTSIPGMPAKPIIDIMVAVGSFSQATGLILLLETLGYVYKPHDTVPERLFFSKESAPEHKTHHLNLTTLHSGFWENQLPFRDYLRTHEEMAAEYLALKKHLVERYAHTQEIDPEGKTEFVLRVLELAKKGVEGP